MTDTWAVRMDGQWHICDRIPPDDHHPEASYSIRGDVLDGTCWPESWVESAVPLTAAAEPGDRLVILANKNVSRGKYAAAAVHAALTHYGIDHGAVIVLGASPSDIEAECTSVIHDAGLTEVAPLTVTAGIQEDR